MYFFLHMIETSLLELDSHRLQELSPRNCLSVLDMTKIESKTLKCSSYCWMLEALLSSQILQLLDRLFTLVDHTQTGCSLDEEELRFTAITHATHKFTQIQYQTHTLSRGRGTMRCLFFPLYFSLRKRWLSWRGGSSNVGLISDGKSGEDKEQPHIGIDAYLTHIDLDVHGLLIHRKSEL